MKPQRIDALFDYEKGSLQSTKCVAGEYDFITAASDWKTHKEFTHEGEYLIFAAAAAGSLGRTHYINGKFISSDLCFIISPKDEENFPIDLQFYHIIFRELKSDIVARTKSGTSKESINLGNFGKYKLPYFPISKQFEIKSSFVKAEKSRDSLTDKLENQLELVIELRQAFLREAMQGKLIPQDTQDEPAEVLLEKIKAEKEKLIAEKKIKNQKPLPEIKPEEIPFEIPNNWTWCMFPQIADNSKNALKAGPFGSSLKKEFYVPRGYKIYGQEQVIKQNPFWGDYYIDKERFEKLSSCEVKSGDILISLVGTMGKVLILPDGIEKGIINPRLVKLTLYQKINRQFIKYYLYSTIAIEQINHYSHGSTMNIINLGIIKKLLLPLPPLAEQKRIVEKLEKLMAFCDELEANIQESKTNAENLLQVALKEALESK